MEVAGAPDEIYEVILFAAGRRQRFARFQGVREL
jgi:hypothetical protein